MTSFAVFAYVIAMLAANLIVARLGPAASPFIAFAFIGLDLVLRDWLHFRLRAYHMAGLIVCTGVLTFLMNPAAGQIAIASSAAFVCAALVDWMVFASVRGSWLLRSNSSNVAGAVVDSVVFVGLAFNTWMPEVIAAQIVAKVAGGVLWSMVLQRRAAVTR